MKKVTVYYSVQNGGDGSAYPRFMESRELAEWDQDHQYEGWGESCTGTFEFEADNFNILSEVKTKEEYFAERNEWDSWVEEDEAEEFIEQFFPDGLPTFTVELNTEHPSNDSTYGYYKVFADGEYVYENFMKKDRVETFLTNVNSVPTNG